MGIPDINELVGYDVVAVMGRSRSCHGVAVEIEDSKADRKQRDHLKGRRSLVVMNHQPAMEKPTMPTTLMMIAPF